MVNLVTGQSQKAKSILKCFFGNSFKNFTGDGSFHTIMLKSVTAEPSAQKLLIKLSCAEPPRAKKSVAGQAHQPLAEHADPKLKKLLNTDAIWLNYC